MDASNGKTQQWRMVIFTSFKPAISSCTTDARYRHHYYLTPTCVSEVELKTPSLAELA
jgi:hypothetical protein